MVIHKLHVKRGLMGLLLVDGYGTDLRVHVLPAVLDIATAPRTPLLIAPLKANLRAKRTVELEVASGQEEEALVIISVLVSTVYRHRQVVQVWILEPDLVVAATKLSVTQNRQT